MRYGGGVPAPFVNKVPVPGDKVYIDFGDGRYDHDEVEGVVAYISDEHISVTWESHGHHVHKRFLIDRCTHIEVLEED